MIVKLNAMLVSSSEIIYAPVDRRLYQQIKTYHAYFMNRDFLFKIRVVERNILDMHAFLSFNII